jgi:hypothetical protein
MFNKYSNHIFILIVSLITITSCVNYHDKDLMVPDGYGGGMTYTTLGCLVHGPWEGTDDPPIYGLDLYLNGKLIRSQGYNYDSLDSDLVFDLNKDGSIRYWLKSENREFADQTYKNKNEDVSSKIFTYVNKYYNKGYWKFNFPDSTVSIYFEQANIPNLIFKFKELGANYGIFFRSRFIDSTINGQKCKLKEVKYYHYIHPFFKF